MPSHINVMVLAEQEPSFKPNGLVKVHTYMWFLLGTDEFGEWMVEGCHVIRQSQRSLHCLEKQESFRGNSDEKLKQSWGETESLVTDRWSLRRCGKRTECNINLEVD